MVHCYLQRVTYGRPTVNMIFWGFLGRTAGVPTVLDTSLWNRTTRLLFTLLVFDIWCRGAFFATADAFDDRPAYAYTPIFWRDLVVAPYFISPPRCCHCAFSTGRWRKPHLAGWPRYLAARPLHRSVDKQRVCSVLCIFGLRSVSRSVKGQTTRDLRRDEVHSFFVLSAFQWMVVLLRRRHSTVRHDCGRDAMMKICNHATSFRLINKTRHPLQALLIWKSKRQSENFLNVIIEPNLAVLLRWISLLVLA